MERRDDERVMTSPHILYGPSEMESLGEYWHQQYCRSPEGVEAFPRKWGGETRESGRNVTEDSNRISCHGLPATPRGVETLLRGTPYARVSR